MSSHLIPEDFDYNQVDEPAFVSADEEVRIQQGTEVRLRIVGTRTDASEIVSPSPHMAPNQPPCSLQHDLSPMPCVAAVLCGQHQGRLPGRCGWRILTAAVPSML